MKDDELNLDSLMVFAHVVRERSFSGAARKLNRPKQSVHRQLKQFEDALSRKLLQKKKRGVVPTKIGLELFQVAERIREESRLGLSLLRERSPEVSTLIRVTAPPLLAETFLSPIISSFLETHPGARLDFLLSNDVLDLDDHHVDLAFRIGLHRARGTENYRSVRLGSASRIVVATSSYLKKHGTPKSAADLSAHRVLHFGSLNAFSQAHWTMRKRERLDPVVAASSPYLILDLVLRGNGIGLLPEMICSELLKSKALRKLFAADMVSRVPVFLLIREDVADLPAVRELVEGVEAAALRSDWLGK